MFKRYFLLITLGLSFGLSNVGFCKNHEKTHKISLTGELVQDLNAIHAKSSEDSVSKQILNYLSINIPKDLMLEKDLRFISKELSESKEKKLQFTHEKGTVITKFNRNLYLGLKDWIKLKMTPQQGKSVLLSLLIASSSTPKTIPSDLGYDEVEPLNPVAPSRDPSESANPVAIFFSNKDLSSHHPNNDAEAPILHRFVLCVYYEAFKFFRSVRDEKALKKTINDAHAIDNFSKAVWENLKNDLERAIKTKDIVNPEPIKKVFYAKVTPKSIEKKVINALYFHENFFQYLKALTKEKTTTDNTVRQAFINYMSSGDKIASELKR